jgi:hypothetical protein
LGISKLMEWFNRLLSSVQLSTSGCKYEFRSSNGKTHPEKPLRGDSPRRVVGGWDVEAEESEGGYEDRK